MNSPNSLDDWTTSPVEGEDEAARSLAGLQQELDRTRAQLGMLQLLKRQTMHRVNHDLCTPLVTALGYLEMLVEGRLGKIPARAEARVQVALSNLQRLTRIFDDIVVYNRLLSTEDDRIAPAPVALSLVELLQECAGDFRRAWPGMCFRGEACTWTGPRGGPQRRGSRSRSRFIGAEANASPCRRATCRELASLRFDIPADLPRVLADPRLVRQTIAALLENADRHAGARARIWLEAEPTRWRTVRISIGDDGVGMSEELQTQVLAFGREALDGPLGFGIRLAQAVLRAHGQTLRLESRVGAGTIVSFELQQC